MDPVHAIRFTAHKLWIALGLLQSKYPKQCFACFFMFFQYYDPWLVSFTAMCMHGGACITRWHPQNCLATSSTVSHSAWPLLRKNKHAFCVACAVKHELHNFLFDLNNVKIRSSLQRNLQKSLRLTTLLVVSTHPLPREKLSKRWVCNCSIHSTRTKHCTGAFTMLRLRRLFHFEFLI